MAATHEGDAMKLLLVFADVEGFSLTRSGSVTMILRSVALNDQAERQRPRHQEQ